VREILELSQSDLALKLGLKGYLTILRYENGERKPSVSKLDIFEKVLNVSKSWLLSNELNQNYCYEIQSTIRLNQTSIDELSKELDVTSAFLNAIMESQVSPSRAFFERAMLAIGVEPQGNLRDRVVAESNAVRDTKTEINENELTVLKFRIEKYARDLDAAQLCIEKLFSENEALKAEIKTLKSKIK
jgi:transcriptional regulator with XRE-family HTH domain